jgi:hypothetical protein
MRSTKENQLHTLSWGARRMNFCVPEFNRNSTMERKKGGANGFGIRFAQVSACGRMFHTHHTQGDLMRFHVFRIPIAAAAGLAGLIGCNSPESPVTSISDDPDEGRYHEKSFSWGESSGGLPKASALAGIAGKQTTFATQDELVAAVKALDEKLKDHDFTDSLWKPVDYACDELDLAVWNEYGTVLLDDSVVFDATILKERCRSIDENRVLRKSASDNPPGEAIDRQYPYKMIGRSWDNFNLGVYKSTGAETQFKKRRSIWGVTGWYDLDATRIGVRIYLFDCGKSDVGSRVCLLRRSTSDWYKNDDYVSKREPAFGINVGGTLTGWMPNIGWKPVWTPDQFNSRLSQIDEQFHNAGLTYIDLTSWLGDFYEITRAWTIPIPDFGLMNLRVADGVMALHSVDHAGLKFRATSSSGLGAYNATQDVYQFDFVTW